MFCSLVGGAVGEFGDQVLLQQFGDQVLLQHMGVGRLDFLNYNKIYIVTKTT